jgi:redox-sensitive bicupin YhaK (pirin superfamily)
MTAGHGVAHAEEGVAGRRLRGAQLWVAQPEATRWSEPAFAHHAELPQVDLGGGTATVLVGALDGSRSPARTDTPLIGAELDLRGGATALPLDPTFEHAVVVVDGAVTLDGRRLAPGHLGYLGLGRDELVVEATEPSRALLIGGEPFEATPLMWWNYVARSWDEVQEAHDDWQAGSDRFGETGSPLDRIPSLPPKNRR